MPKSKTEKVGARVADQRKRLDMSQRALAEESKIDFWRICRIEKGHGRGVLADELVRIAKVLGVPFTYLLGKAAE